MREAVGGDAWAGRAGNCGFGLPRGSGRGMTDWEGIVRSHGRAVWRTAWRVLADSADADDCMQEAFVDAVELSRREPVRDWGRLLTRLATSRALDRLRRRIREAKRRNGHAGNGTSH